jgi:hypothetical protein
MWRAHPAWIWRIFANSRTMQDVRHACHVARVPHANVARNKGCYFWTPCSLLNSIQFNPIWHSRITTSPQIEWIGKDCTHQTESRLLSAGVPSSWKYLSMVKLRSVSWAEPKFVTERLAIPRHRETEKRKWLVIYTLLRYTINYDNSPITLILFMFLMTRYLQMYLWESRTYNEEPAKLNRDVALRALWTNSLFLRLFSVKSCPNITHLFW